MDTEPPKIAQTESDPETAREFTVGNGVHEGDDDKPAAGYVTTLPEATAEMWTAYGKTTVAEDNPEYPSEAQVRVGVNENKRHHISESDGST